MKSKYFLLFGSSTLLIGVFLLAIDRYYFSWSSLLRVGSTKNIRREAGAHKLTEHYDLKKIAENIPTGTGYKAQFTGPNRLFIVRNFQGTPYSLVLFRISNTSGSEVTVSFGNFSGDYSIEPNVERGEPKTTPNFLILSNIRKMLDDLPFDPAQKNELLSQVAIVVPSSSSVYR